MGRLLQAAKTTQQNRGGITSIVDRTLETLEGEDRDDLLAVLNDPAQYGHAVVSRLVYEVHGIRISQDSVFKWRRRVLGGE